MLIFIRTKTGYKLTIDVKYHDTIADVKEKIEKKGIPISNIFERVMKN